LFYGYNPVYLITFVVFWFYSLEELSHKVAHSYFDALGDATSPAVDYSSISQNVDWP
jgi:hypothetical protein